MTINLLLQEDRSPSRTGRAQFQTHADDNARPTGTYKPPPTPRWTPQPGTHPSSLADLATPPDVASRSTITTGVAAPAPASPAEPGTGSASRRCTTRTPPAGSADRTANRRPPTRQHGRPRSPDPCTSGAGSGTDSRHRPEPVCGPPATPSSGTRATSAVWIHSRWIQGPDPKDSEGSFERKTSTWQVRAVVCHGRTPLPPGVAWVVGGAPARQPPGTVVVGNSTPRVGGGGSCSRQSQEAGVPGNARWPIQKERASPVPANCPSGRDDARPNSRPKR